MIQNYYHDNLNINAVYYRKKALKSNAAQIGVATLIHFFILFFAAVPIVMVVLLLGYDQKLLEDPFFNQLIQLIVFPLLALVFFVLAKCKKMKISRIVSFSLPKKKLTTAFLMSGMAFSLLASSASSIFCVFLTAFGMKVPDVDIPYPTGVSGIALSVITMVILPAFLEEFMMRGIVLGIMRPFGDKIAIFASAFIFSIMHASILQIPFTFLLGLLLGFMVVKTESIWPAVILHGMNNAMAVASGYIDAYFGGTASEIFTIAVFVLALISAVFGITILLKRQGLTLESGKGDLGVLSEKQKIKCFLFSPVIIICTVCSVLAGFLLR